MEPEIQPSYFTPAPQSPKTNPFLIPASIIIAGLLVGLGIFMGLFFSSSAPKTPVPKNSIDPKTLPAIAQSLGIDKKKFSQCLDSGKYTSKIMESTVDVQNAGGSGTPFSIIVSKAKISPTLKKFIADTNNQFLSQNQNAPDVLSTTADQHMITLSGAMPAQLMDIIISDLIKTNTGQGDLGNSFTINKVRAVTAEDHVLGSLTAPITIIEYSDTDCPYCQLFQATLENILKKNESSGKIAWVYRHFNTGIHKNTVIEAEALECATEIGGNEKFWQLLTTIFSKKDFTQ